MAKPDDVPPLLPPAPYTRPSMSERAQRGPLRPGEYDMRPRIGLSVMPLETRREAIIALATEGDRLGYDGFFMPETWGYDMTVLLAEAAARTTRITLGTGIVGIWNRSAATIAMAAATLHGISGGRFVLGLGASTPQLAEVLHDTPFEPPLPRMRRMVTQIRALLLGERIPLAVTTNARALKLPAVVADTDAKAREGAAWFVSFYVTTMGTIYRDSLTRQSYGKAVEAVLSANAPKFTGVVPADAEELLEQLTAGARPVPPSTPEERALALEAFRPMLPVP